MNIFDACKVLGLSGQFTREDVKKAYRIACSQYHPDKNPAGLEMMKLVNVAYEVLEAFDFKQPIMLSDAACQYGEIVNAALNNIIHLSGLIIEVCGAWVWIGGDTKSHKDALKTAGFQWAPKKQRWYFRPEDYKSKARGQLSMDDIRGKYGSEKVDAPHTNRLCSL
jgi:hypothetical protein